MVELRYEPRDTSPPATGDTFNHHLILKEGGIVMIVSVRVENFHTVGGTSGVIQATPGMEGNMA